MIPERRWSSCIAIVGLLFSAASNAEVADFAIDSGLFYGYGNAAGVSMQQTAQAEAKLEYRMSDRWLTVLSARVRLDIADELEPGESPVDTYSDASRPLVIDDLGTLELRDAYVERLLHNGVLRLGKQQIVWGRLDGIKVLDVLNPMNLREFILEDFGESRIGLWSAYLDVSTANWRFEIAAIPDNTGHAIADQGAWFELTAPRYRYGADPDGPVPSVITDRGNIGLDNSAIGVRLSSSVGNAEFSLLGYSGLDHEPLGRLLSIGNEIVVERFYERRELLGLSFETALGAVALRAELAHQPGRVFNTRDPLSLETVDLDQNTAAIGIDIDGPLDMFINIQYLYDRLEDAPQNVVRPAIDRTTTVYLRRSFAYEALELTARWYYSQVLGDQMLSLGLRYAFSDNTAMRLAADNFRGDASGPFGQFADQDRITLALTHTF
jgi:hypothetical protein